jgi:hypothetical protein
MGVVRPEIEGTLNNERADRIMHHLAECHREIRSEQELDPWDKGELGRLIDAAKDTINRHREPESGGGDRD